MDILDGKALALERRAALAVWVQERLSVAGRPPGLSVLVAGDDAASATYVRSKERAAAKAGIQGEVQNLPAGISQNELLARIHALNADEAIDGILVQLPLPKELDENEVLDAIDPEKDVDGFHPSNSGALWQQRGRVAPCTPLGIMHLLAAHNIEVCGKHAVVVGRSNIVGRPMAELLLQKNATVTIAHSRTTDLPNLLSSADLVVSAVGRAGFIQPEWLKPGVVCIDVGINRVDGRLVGDFQWQGLENVASAATPVPGGVGPMTIATLMHNTIASWARHCGLDSSPT
ncbi:MAG: bifunctional methylenetetrahydrofolate dehydrogenase/methenyltetrahydrofolate cyclohydrolase FolD [Myxococcota bacterium]|nr:bifunctional methylenetetrahydrofolate dehydrogenase/methenyltetrahydrofolate cyclohydrolase FolD [Myxococcota bacterium]